MLGFFKREPLLDEESVEWLFEAFGWSLRSFGSTPFYQNTILVTPTPKHFPGSGTSIEAMADLMMNRVKDYAGLSYWPTQAVDHHQFRGDPNDVPSVHQMLSALAGEGDSQQLVDVASQGELILFYEPKQVGNPEVMIANFSHALMVHLAALAELAPPCEHELLPHLTEVMAVTHGFGLMFANTATPYRGGGCGSCRSPAMERVGNLSEREVAYALAIFSVLKEVPEKEVTRHLKKTLKGFFKKALVDVNGREAMLADLKVIDAPSHFNKYEAAIPTESKTRL